jgi:hypothetical protein
MACGKYFPLRTLAVSSSLSMVDIPVMLTPHSGDIDPLLF